MSVKIYKDKDAELKHFEKKVCAVIGFGSQGKAQALNLKESGVTVIIGLYEKSKSRSLAKKLGFQVFKTAETVKKADIILLALPDLIIASVFQKEIAPHLTAGKTILFSHGFAIHYQTIIPPPGVDVIMVAPNGPGTVIRKNYLEKKGTPASFAVFQNATGHAKKIALAWAKAIGCTRAGVLETTFREETETDLFGEQVVLCGGVTSLIHTAFETLVEAGYQPETAYLVVLYELKLTVDLIHENGIAGMRDVISEMAKYGDITVGPTIINASVKKKMEKALKNIQSGKFTKEWMKEYQSGKKKYHALLKKGKQHPIESVSKRVRKMMLS